MENVNIEGVLEDIKSNKTMDGLNVDDYERSKKYREGFMKGESKGGLTEGKAFRYVERVLTSDLIIRGLEEYKDILEDGGNNGGDVGRLIKIHLKYILDARSLYDTGGKSSIDKERLKRAVSFGLMVKWDTEYIKTLRIN